MSAPSTPTLFLGGPAEFIQQCKEAASRCSVQIVGDAVSPADLYMLVDRVHPNGLLLPSGHEWAHAAADLAAVRPNMLVFVSGPIRAETWERLAKHRVMTVPADPEQAVPGAVSAIGRLSIHRFEFEDREVAPPKMSGRPRTVTIPAKTIAVYSAKGGAGKTTVAENMAALLGLWAKKQEEETGSPCRVALLDTNLDGSTGVYTWSPHSRPKTVSLWRDLADALRWQDVAGAMNYNGVANVWYLAPPLIPEEKERFDRPLIEKILAGCQRFFHFTVIDTGVALKDRDATVAALVAATDILLVADFRYKSLRLLSDAYKHEIRQMAKDPLKFSLVLNRVKRSWFNTRDFVAAFAKEAGDAIPLRGEVPEEPALEKRESEVRGVPFVCVHSETDFSRSIMSLCRGVLGADIQLAANGDAGSPGGWLRRLFGVGGL